MAESQALAPETSISKPSVQHFNGNVSPPGSNHSGGYDSGASSSSSDSPNPRRGHSRERMSVEETQSVRGDEMAVGVTHMQPHTLHQHQLSK